jgi:hypothetical protein
VADGIPSQSETDAPGRPGRSCPLSYRYSPAVFRRDPEIRADTLYVVGGLYGNAPALEALMTLASREAAPPVIVFNGDFNWFNRDAAGFREINTRVLQHVALRGNVETELAGEEGEAGCGCGYPDDVGDAEVERSNTILRELRRTALSFAGLRERLGALPMHAVAQVGDARIGIVHGDAESLAGWGFAHDQLDSPSRREWLHRVFSAAEVDVFASSHTCLPALRAFSFGNAARIVVNNGAAGMPNFTGLRAGLITRIGTTPFPGVPDGAGIALQSARALNAHVQTLRLDYDIERWDREFLANWPAGSPAHESYFRRIQEGPRFTPGQAFARPSAQ